jgi:hypothetical protein
LGGIGTQGIACRFLVSGIIGIVGCYLASDSYEDQSAISSRKL